MSYPRTPKAFETAVLSYSPPAAVSDEAWDEALTAPSVPRIVKVFDLLRPIENLDTAGRRLLAGAAHLIGSHNFFSRGGEAMGTLVAIAPTLPAIVEEEGVE